MILAIDFDGTIVEETFPNIGKEIPGAIEALKRIQKAGHFVIIWTCREGKHLKDAEKYLNERGFFPDAMNDHHPGAIEAFQLKYPLYNKGSRKVWAHIYIDDKHLGGIPGWPEIERMIAEKSNKEKKDVK